VGRAGKEFLGLLVVSIKIAGSNFSYENFQNQKN
jgi:hypothetical protein